MFAPGPFRLVKILFIFHSPASIVLSFFLPFPYFCRKKPMTAAAYSADGSVLAVAAETVITLWDPDRNYLVAVIGETHAVI